MEMRYFFKLHRAPIIGALSCTNAHSEDITVMSFMLQSMVGGVFADTICQINPPSKKVGDKMHFKLMICQCTQGGLKGDLSLHRTSHIMRGWVSFLQ